MSKKEEALKIMSEFLTLWEEVLGRGTLMYHPPPRFAFLIPGKQLGHPWIKYLNWPCLVPLYTLAHTKILHSCLYQNLVLVLIPKSSF